MLGQGGGPSGPPGAPPQGPPDSAPPGEQQDTGGGDHAQMIKDLLDLARQVAQSADDAAEAKTLEQVTSLLAGILAAQQKQQHDLLQGKMPPAAMVKALSGP